jgi:hypothetical protein
MTETEKPQNPFFHILYQSLLEIIGPEQVIELLKRQGLDLKSCSAEKSPFLMADILGRIGSQLSKDHGIMATRGLLIRSGRASLVFLRRYFSQVAGLGSLENRLHPLEKRFKDSLGAMASFWSQQTGLDSEVELIGQLEFTWRMKLSPMNEDQNWASFFLFGILEEFCLWLDARKSYQIGYPGSGPDGMVEIFIAVQSQE